MHTWAPVHEDLGAGPNPPLSPVSLAQPLPHPTVVNMSKEAPAIGIDLGTTYRFLNFYFFFGFCCMEGHVEGMGRGWEAVGAPGGGPAAPITGRRRAPTHRPDCLGGRVRHPGCPAGREGRGAGLGAPSIDMRF